MKSWTKLVATSVMMTFLAGMAEARTLRIGHGTTETNPRHVAAQFFAKRVDELSAGRLKISVGGNAQFGDDVEMLTALRLGTLDMSLNAQGPLANIVPEVGVLSLPFMFKDSPSAWKVLDGPVGEELAAKADGKQLVVLAYWDNGIRHITNNVRPITAPADLKGLKIRVPSDPVAIETFTALGASPTPMAFSELYLALQQGVVDGQENPLMNIFYSKFQEVQKFLSLSSHKYEMTPFLMSKVTWTSLSAEDRKVIKQAALEARDHQRELTTQADRELRQKLEAAGMKINDVDIEPFRAATKGVFEKWQSGPHGELVKRLIAATQLKGASQ
jgi:tripartite ATP-independent transporter DctP family solute receptor